MQTMHKERASLILIRNESSFDIRAPRTTQILYRTPSVMVIFLAPALATVIHYHVLQDFMIHIFTV